MLTFAPHQSFGDCQRTLAVAGSTIRDTWLAPRAVLPLHRHQAPYLCITLAGHYEEVANARTPCGPGSLLAHPGDDAHANVVGPRAARCVNVEFTPALLEEPPLRELLRAPRHLPLSPAHEALARLHAALGLRDDTAPLSALGAVLDLVCEAAAPRTAQPTPSPALRRVREVLEADLSRTPSLAELAAVADMHASHLTRSFRRAFGESIGAYLRRRRLDAADLWLRQGELPLARIAVEAGFSDQAHFTRAYRRRFGLTPGRRRRSGAG
jgi:AraC family transcriptional regulator